jgi:hypothetical protein
VARAFDDHQAAARYQGGGRTPGEFEGSRGVHISLDDPTNRAGCE